MGIFVILHFRHRITLQYLEQVSCHLRGCTGRVKDTQALQCATRAHRPHRHPGCSLAALRELPPISPQLLSSSAGVLQPRSCTG